MTTIATDGITVASDSQRVAGSERIDLSTKKIQKRNGHVFAFTGDFGIFDPAIEWFLTEPRDPEKAPKVSKDGGWSLLVMGPHHVMRYSDTLPYGEPWPYPQAFGSGATYAMAALRLGKSPAEAIELAASLDIYTAGPIQVVNISEALGLQPVREAAE
jgi:hypothetical protein